ncbi:hypothetical protein Lal_00002552 [Lupinus albus]|nr:hypothetical protein Lal_00002552 [Lupinus albus]
MPKKVLIAARSFSRSKEAKAILEAQGYELILNPYDRPMTEAELVEMIAGVDALVAGNDDVTGAVIAAGAPDLKIIAKHGVGYNNIDVSTAKQYGIPVTVAPGANSQSVAELAFGLLLACVRSIPQMDCSIRAGSWDRVTGYEVGGKVLGIVGMGNIGGEVAKRACGFNMKIIAYDIYPNPEFIKNYGVTYLPLPEVIAQADFLSLHAPSTPGTVGMINRTTLRTMKKTAFLINTARGDLVNEEDLYEALSSGIIAGAALDTFAKEPLENSPLLTLKNIIVTPHAGAATHEGVIRTGLIGAGEVVRVLSGKKAIITGGGSGLGLGMAQGLQAAGAEVAIIDIMDSVPQVAQEMAANGTMAYGIKGDLGNRESLQTAFNLAVDKLGGRLDILVNSAGIQRRSKSEEFPIEYWDAVVEINMTSVFLLCQLAGRKMLEQGQGKIINVASMLSYFGGYTVPAYAASKGGVAQLTKALANEWAGRGVNVNAVAPGYMDTAMNTALVNDPVRNEQILARIPAGRWGTGEDMQGAVIFLASSYSDYINGAIIPVDGGFLSR